jgi:hypothetical protein
VTSTYDMSRGSARVGARMPPQIDDVAALRQRLAALVWERRLTEELACELRYYAVTLIERGDDLAADITKLRIKIRIAEWRGSCGRLPDHLKQIDRKAAA